MIAEEVVQIVQDLNPWWTTGRTRTPPPSYLRVATRSLIERLSRRRGVIEMIRGPRQVGKTTTMDQAIAHLLGAGVPARNVLFLRFDQQVLRASGVGLLALVRWYQQQIRRTPFERGRSSFLFLDEIDKLPRWDEDVKHLCDTFPVRLVVTGSSSVLVTRGGRESLAGRTHLTELPTFGFREMLEAWAPGVDYLPPARSFASLMETDPREVFGLDASLHPQRRLSLNRRLEKYYARGGYPRLHNGEVDDDEWADYLSETIFERVLGVDVPDLFPVRNPGLLRWLYIEVARATGQQISQNRLAEDAGNAGYHTNQPSIGNYLRCLQDALLIREFRRYPVARRSSARTPAKITLSDLGPRNAIFHGAPSLWESAEDRVGPLVETIAQSVIRGPQLQVHFYRDHEKPGDRRTPLREVDFVVEDLSGRTLPIEIKFRRNIRSEDRVGLKSFMTRFGSPWGILVSRATSDFIEDEQILVVPLLQFLLAF